jgi:hypothetical protein
LLTESTEIVDSVAKGVTVALFVLQYQFAGAFKKVIGTLLSLQILCHLGLLNVKLPGNTTATISSLKAVTYFNPLSWVAKANLYIFTFSAFDQANTKLQMILPLKNIGFPSTNVIMATGNLGQMIALFLLTAMVYYPILKRLTNNAVIYRCLKRCMPSIDKQITESAALYWNPLLGFCYRGCIPLCISLFLNF